MLKNIPVERLKEQRCTSCNALLFKANIVEGKVEYKCRCGVTNTITAENKKPEGRSYQDRLQLVAK